MVAQPDPPQFRLIRAHLDALVAAHAAQLNRDLYSANTFDQIPCPPIRPLTARERASRRIAHVRGYLSTLWAALRGCDLVAADDETPNGW